MIHAQLIKKYDSFYHKIGTKKLINIVSHIGFGPWTILVSDLILEKSTRKGHFSWRCTIISDECSIWKTEILSSSLEYRPELAEQRRNNNAGLSSFTLRSLITVIFKKINVTDDQKKIRLFHFIW